MRFALLGNHPDGVAMARALAATGRHALAVVCDVAPPPFAPLAKVYPDVEEVLADPQVELVIVAGAIGARAEQLRRAIQSERDTLCVHPSSEKPDAAYEAALIQTDTGRLLLPLLPNVLHPVYARVGELLSTLRAELGATASPFQLLHCIFPSSADGSPAEPGWDVLRRLGGEIVEMSALAPTEEIEASAPLVFNGRFESGAMIQGTLLPAANKQIVIRGPGALIEINGPDAQGAASLRWQTGDGPWNSTSFGETDCWRLLADAVDAARADPGAASISWQDEIRGLELIDALRRSVRTRRTSGLEHQEINEEVGSKGTLTLIGCGMIWLLLLMSLVAIWVPQILWAVVPMLIAYLALLGMNVLAKRT